MSERRRRYSFHSTSQPGFFIEERQPEKSEIPLRPKRRTLIFQSFEPHHRRRERPQRAPSPIRYYARRPRAPTPPPRFDSPPLLDTMPPKPKETSATKPFVPLPKPLPSKKADKPKDTSKPSDKSKENTKDKSKDRPTVKIYEKGHRPARSYDTGYASGYSSPWSVEERSPLDYNPKTSKSGVDQEPYEIITGASRRRYPKLTGQRTPDTPISPEPRKEVRYVTGERPGDAEIVTERKKPVRYVVRSPDSPGDEDEYIPLLDEPKKDKQARVMRTTKVLQEQLAQESETAMYNYEAARREEAQRLAQIESLQAELRRNRLERQLAEGRAAEAERKLKQQEIDEVGRREKELKQQLGDEQKRREEDILRREADLMEKQWREIEASPPRVALQRRTTALVEQERRVTAPHRSSESTIAAQSPSVLDLDSPFLAPILEAQRDEAARKAREAQAERRSGIEVRETSRSTRQRPRRDDRYK